MFLFFLSSNIQKTPSILYKNQHYFENNKNDKDAILKILNNFFSSSGKNLNFIDFKIVVEVDEKTSQKYKYILFEDNNNESINAILLIPKSKKSNIMHFDNRIVSCSGQKNCKPIYYDNNWIWDAELNTYKCLKSVTIIMEWYKT